MKTKLKTTFDVLQSDCPHLVYIEVLIEGKKHQAIVHQPPEDEYS